MATSMPQPCARPTANSGTTTGAPTAQRPTWRPSAPNGNSRFQPVSQSERGFSPGHLGFIPGLLSI